MKSGSEEKLEGLFAATEGPPAVPMPPFYRDFLMRNGFYSKEDSTRPENRPRS